MSKVTDDDPYSSGDDLDEDEAMQYIIEQSLIQYRKLKGLNPRSVSDCRDHLFYRLIPDGRVIYYPFNAFLSLTVT